MNSFQIHKLSLAINDKKVSQETRNLIRLLLAERMELLEVVNRIKQESDIFIKRSQEMK